jgi:hypothetical protein
MRGNMPKSMFFKLGMGNVLLTVCGIFYLVWWLIAFSPKEGVNEGRGAGFVIAAALFGMAGVYLIITGLGEVKPDVYRIAPGVITVSGIIAYFVVMAVTKIIFRRPVTTELILITGWTMMMFLMVSKLSAVTGLNSTAAGVVFFLLAAEYIFCMVCYTLYYRLDENLSYIDGAVPLIIEIVTMTVASAAVFLKMRG